MSPLQQQQQQQQLADYYYESGNDSSTIMTNHDEDDRTSTTNTNEQSSNSTQRQSAISFGTVSVREYERIVGDHPDVKVGPPIAIGWQYDEVPEIPLDDYEASHLPKQNLRLSSITRRNLLVNVWEIPEEEVVSSTKEVQKIRESREQAKKQSKTSERTEAFMESAKRKIRRRGSKILSGMLKTNAMMFPSSGSMMVSVP